MDDNFNERIFDNITNDISKRINSANKSSKMNMNDLENVINDMLNDETSVKTHERNNIIKYSSLIKEEVNKTEFDETYLKSRYARIKDFHKMKLHVNNDISNKIKRPFGNINYGMMIKNVSSSFMNISKDLVLLFFTVCIVAHLKIRSYIQSCYLYPSNPNRFPYVLYNRDSVKQKNILNI